MNMKSICTAVLSIFIYSGSVMAMPTTFNANNYVEGANVTNAVAGVTIEAYNHVFGSSEVTYSSAFIESVADCPDPYTPVTEACMRNGLSLYGNNTSYHEFLREGGFFNTLEETYSFSGMSFTFDQQLDWFSAEAFSRSGDANWFFLFDQDDNFLRAISNQITYPICQFGDNIACQSYSLFDNLEGESVYRIVVGSGGSNTWLDKLTFSVPEVSSIYLLAFGLLGLFGHARRKV